MAENNCLVHANADYIGPDGRSANTYRRNLFDTATGNRIHDDGQVYDPRTGN